jgi:Restriction endonuclease
VAKQGSEYEQFVYDKFRRLFVDSTVTLNDKILGKQSGLEPEIDVSVKTTVESEQLLYIVQCKDRAQRPADIVILGEFSSVIKDVGAAKGFLICTSGFVKSNYQYALTLGIELLTVEDINSDRWKVDIQIPLVYVRKAINYAISAEIVANEALVEKNRGQELVIHFDVSSLVTLDNGSTVAPIKDYIETWLVESGFDAPEGVELDLLRRISASASRTSGLNAPVSWLISPLVKRST